MNEAAQQQVFEDWLSQYRSLIFKIVRAYAYSSASQDDLFQEVAIQVWKSVPRFRGESSPSTWIYRITLNVAIKWSQREQRHTRTESLDTIQHVLQPPPEPINDRLQWLYREIQKLNEIDRSLVLLLLDGFSYKEMAAMLGISETNVGVKLNRLKKYLIQQSEKLEHHGL